jgi:hypothetical protein
MSRRHPPIHPEYLAGIGATAREVGRFVVEVSDEVIGEKQARRRHTANKGAPSPAQRVFERIMAPVLATARSCRVFNGGQQSGTADTRDVAPAQAQQWLEAYTRADGRGSFDVDLSAPGVRRDLSFWWWLARQRKNPLIFVPLRGLDMPALFALTNGVQLMTFRYDVPKSAVDFAKRETKRNDVICLSPVGEDLGLLFRIYASPDTAAHLAQLAFEHGRRPPDERALLTRFDRCILEETAPATFWRNLVVEENPEAKLRSALKRWERRPTDAADALRALAAAEIVATLEGRPRAGSDGDETLRDVRKWAAKQDALDADTVDMAYRVVGAIASGDRLLKEWRTDEARTAWRAEFRALAKRLEAAQVARRTRASAPNAAPRVATWKTPEELQSPERWSAMYFYALKADAQELLDFVREETGAILHVALESGELHALTSSWDVRAVLDGAFGGSFDERKIDDPWGLHSGVQLHASWETVGPPPRIRERVSGPEDEEVEAFMRQLQLEPRTEPPFEVFGWGYTSLFFCGAMTHLMGTRQKRTLLRSAFEYPTGGELRRPRYNGPGPWRDVNWKELRRVVRLVRERMLAMAGARVAGTEPIPVLAAAAELARDGGVVASKNGWSEVKLAAGARRRPGRRKSSIGRRSAR